MNVPVSRQVLALIAAVTVVRAVLFSQLELLSTESYLWICAQRPALGYYDYPAMIAWMGAASSAVFGESALGFRALTVLSAGGMVGFVFLAARRLYDEQTARLAALLAAVVPLLFAFSAEATPDAPCLFFWSASVWALAHALSGDSPRWWYAAGLFLGLTVQSKYHGVFLGLGTAGFLIFSPEHRSLLKRKEPWIGVGLALLAFSPTIVWNARNGWQSFAYQGVQRFRESGFEPRELWRFASSQLLLLTPAVCVWAWAAAFGPIFRWRTADWRDRFLAALGAPMLLFFVLVIFIRPVRGHWPAPAYLTILMLTAAVVRREGLWGRRLIGGSAGVLAAGVLLLPVVLAFVPAAQRSGWAALGARVAARKPDFIVSNDYHLASQMGFVLRTTESWDLTPAGKPSKSFPLWWDEAAHLGRNAVVVYEEKRFPRELERIRACFERLDAPEAVVIPRIRILGFGQDERFLLMNAWNYRGAKAAGPRAPD